MAFVVASGSSAAGQPASSRSPSAPPADSLARHALVSLLTGDRRAVAEDYQKAVAREQAAGDQRSLRTSDAILYLFNSTNPDREGFLLGQELALAEARNEELRASILWSLLGDEYYELALLKGENRFNKFTRMFNRASSAVSRAALLQPQAAAQLLLDGFYTARKGRLPTDRERRMLYLGTTFLAKYPTAPEAPEVQELLSQLREKLDTARVERDKTAGLALLEAGKPAAAEFHLERAALLAPQDADLAAALARARRDRDAKEARAALALSVGPAEREFGDKTQKMLKEACEALVTREGERLAELAAAPGPLQDSILYSLACLSERNGHHDDAIQRLGRLAQERAQTPGGRAAAAALANPSYHLETAFQEALDELGRRRREYVLTGNRSTEETAFAAGDAALSQAAVGLPALFFTDMLVRGVAERFRSQVAADEAIDAGARLVRRYPGSPRAREVASQLSKLTQQTGDVDRAEEYLEASGSQDPEQEQKLREEKARTLLKLAMDSGDYVERKQLLQQLREKYPDAKVAATAEKEWVKLPPSLEEGSIVLSRKMLERDPALARSLGIAAELIDGSKSNSEIADEGLAISGKGDRLTFRLKEGDQFFEVRLPSEGRDSLLARARQLRSGYARVQAGKEKGQHRWLPFSLEGGAGSSGVELAPKVQPYKDDPERMKNFR